MAHMEQMMKIDVIKTLEDDIENFTYEYMHLMRELIATRDRGEKDTEWEHTLLCGMNAVNKQDFAALSKVIKKLKQIATE